MKREVPGVTNGRKVQAMADQAVMAAANTTVASIMSREVLTVRPDTSLEAVTELLLERQISGVPVVDEEHKPLGIVSKTDLVRTQHDRQDSSEEEAPKVSWRRGISYPPGPGYHVHPEGATAGDVMSKNVVVVSEGASVQEAAKLMLRSGFHRLPVVSTTGSVVGLITATDVLVWVAGG